MRGIWTLSSIESGRTALWTRGNLPTQRLLRSDPTSTELHLKALYLLSDRILGAASYYFESAITRDLLDGSASILLDRQELLLYASEDVSGFMDHGLRKVEKNRGLFRAYSNRRLVKSIGRTLDRRAPIVLRPQHDISEHIEQLWLADLEDTSHGRLGWIASSIDPSSIDYWRSVMRVAVTNREGDLVWENIAPALRVAGVPREAFDRCRLRLLQLYNQAAAAAVVATSDVPKGLRNSVLDPATSAFDTDLLIGCLRVLGLGERFAHMPFTEVVTLKQSIGWSVFHGVYLELLHHAADDSVLRSVPLIRDISEWSTPGSTGSLSREEFVNTFQEMTALAGVERSVLGDAALADQLFRVAERFGQTPFGLLNDALDAASEVPSHRTKRREEEKAVLFTDLRAFIVHGSDTATVYELKDYLQNVLQLPEPIVLLQQPNSGRTIIEKFEDESQQVDVVFVVLTEDDPSRIGSMQARQNVLYELGYFVGRFGRRSARVILLRRGKVEIPSDLHGVIYIDVSAGIASAGEEIRRELPGSRAHE